MSLKDLKEAYDKKKLIFGIKQAIKLSKDKKKKSIKVFVAKDAREETINILSENQVNFEFSKGKKEISKELGIDFFSEVFLIE